MLCFYLQVFLNNETYKIKKEKENKTKIIATKQNKAQTSLHALFPFYELPFLNPHFTVGPALDVPSFLLLLLTILKLGTYFSGWVSPCSHFDFLTESPERIL